MRNIYLFLIDLALTDYTNQTKVGFVDQCISVKAELMPDDVD